MSQQARDTYLVSLFDQLAEQARDGVLFLVDEAHKLGVDLTTRWRRRSARR